MSLEINGIVYSDAQVENGDYIIDPDKKLDFLKDKACKMVDSNYSTYCESGLSYTPASTEYIIDNNSKTRDEIDKKLANIILDIDSCFNWTMDSPRIKVDFTDKARTLTFLEAVQTRIASNEELLRDKKTSVCGFSLTQVNNYIASPDFPDYGRTV